jgi:hypothetical protein
MRASNHLESEVCIFDECENSHCGGSQCHHLRRAHTDIKSEGKKARERGGRRRKNLSAPHSAALLYLLRYISDTVQLMIFFWATTEKLFRAPLALSHRLLVLAPSLRPPRSLQVLQQLFFALMLPRKKPEADDEKCRSILWNLVEAFSSSSIEANTAPTVLIRELFETERCATQYPKLGNIRENYADFIGKPTLQAILNFTPAPDEFGQERCAQAIIHYHSWTRKMLVEQLCWQDRVYYHTVHRAERTVAILGMVGSVWNWHSHGAASRSSHKDMVEQPSVPDGTGCR